MPFLDEQELASLHQEIHDANVRRDDIEQELKNKQKKLDTLKRKSRGINLFFATLAGFAFAGIVFLYQQKKEDNPSLDINIETIRQETKNQILDSIANIEYENTENTVESVDKSVESIKNGIRDREIYSVQIGIFSEKKHAVLSETFAGISSTQEGLLKYSIGLFNTLEEAQKFRKSLVIIGFKDAFVAAYVNGKRKRIENPN